MSDEFDVVDRERGILTKRDREILLGRAGEELDQNAMNVRRYDIRNRIENAIHDFRILAENLPLSDVQQLFDPAYKWSKERRRLNDQGRQSATPDITPVLWSWLTLFDFYSYGMFVGGKPETQILMRGLVESGVERAFRRYQYDFYDTYEEVDASFTLDYESPVLQQNYLEEVQNQLNKQQEDVAEAILDLYHQRKIPQNVAAEWMQTFVGNTNFD